MRKLCSVNTGRVSLLLPILVLMACVDGVTGPSRGVIATSYLGTYFTTTSSGGQDTDQLAAGSTLSITLHADGTTSGHLHVAASATDPVFDADLAGTWTLNGSTVNITTAADTFIRNMPFTAITVTSGGGEFAVLAGDEVFSGTRIQLTLSPNGMPIPANTSGI